MIDLRAFESLGAANHGWLDARHHFSFADYHDPQRMHWGRLRVWNDDVIAPNSGFAPHPHNDMEIITYIRQGAITHRDNQGHVGRTAAGDVQVMSAGTGIVHSEFNMESEETRLFQIWIMPDVRGAKPSWGTRPFPKEDRENRFVILASGFAEDSEALPINVQARVLGATLKAGAVLDYSLGNGRKAYLVPASGAVEIEGVRVNARDGAAISASDTLRITALEESELVMVDVA